MQNDDESRLEDEGSMDEGQSIQEPAEEGMTEAEGAAEDAALDASQTISEPPNGEITGVSSFPTPAPTATTTTKDWADNRFVRGGVNLLALAVVALLAFLVYQRVTQPTSQKTTALASNSAPELAAASLESAGGSEAANQPAESEAEAAGGSVALSPLDSASLFNAGGVLRRTNLDTRIPNRTRTDVITYTVDQGDNLFLIAEKYDLDAETILWGNFETLEDNPQFLEPGQVLNILPIDGVYYEWEAGDTVAGIAAEFNVEPEAILSYSGNDVDLTDTVSGTLGLEPGEWVIIPGGTRPLKDWGPPAISRENPASARYYGDGWCGEIYEGAYGTGTFVWPTVDRSISGYQYTGIHPAIDIGGAIGNAVFAADSGVIVFAGWSNYGYGNLLVVDHGNGFQTAYAHLDTIGVGCGQSVYQGGYIGGLGSTGNSSGPHLHFELVYNSAKPNPLDYLR